MPVQARTNINGHVLQATFLDVQPDVTSCTRDWDVDIHIMPSGSLWFGVDAALIEEAAFGDVMAAGAVVQVTLCVGRKQVSLSCRYEGVERGVDSNGTRRCAIRLHYNQRPETIQPELTCCRAGTEVSDCPDVAVQALHRPFRNRKAGRNIMAAKKTSKTNTMAQTKATTPGPSMGASKKDGKTPSAKATQSTAQPKAKKEKAKKLSAIDAAARVLAEAGKPLNCKEMIAAMAEKGYWSSPGGKTPEATLYSAILRQIKVHGQEARFRKAERGKFELNTK